MLYRFFVWVEADSRIEAAEKLLPLDEIDDYAWDGEWDD